MLSGVTHHGRVVPSEDSNMLLFFAFGAFASRGEVRRLAISESLFKFLMWYEVLHTVLGGQQGHDNWPNSIA